MKQLITILICLALVTISCKKEATPIQPKEEVQNLVQVTDSTMIDGVLLELINNNGKAELKVHSDKYTLTGEIKLTPPCYFLRWVGNKVEDFAYADIKVQHTLGITGGNMTTNKEEKETDVIKICKWGTQGMLIKKDSIILTKKILFSRYMHKDVGFDEKDFWDFAHRRNEETDSFFFDIK